MPQYGALVFNDSIIADMAQPFRALNNSLAHMNPASWLALLPLGLPLNPGAAAGSIMAGLSRPEARVISDAVRRFQRHSGPPYPFRCLSLDCSSTLSGEAPVWGIIAAACVRGTSAGRHMWVHCCLESYRPLTEFLK